MCPKDGTVNFHVAMHVSGEMEYEQQLFFWPSAYLRDSSFSAFDGISQLWSDNVTDCHTITEDKQCV